VQFRLECRFYHAENMIHERMCIVYERGMDGKWGECKSDEYCDVG
jgi:hypothetical protein